EGFAGRGRDPRRDPERRRHRARRPARLARRAVEPCGRALRRGGEPAHARRLSRAPRRHPHARARLRRGEPLRARGVSLTPPEDVLEFWFGGEERRGKARAKWFEKNAAFDDEMRRRFGELHGQASRRELEPWRASPEP